LEVDDSSTLISLEATEENLQKLRFLTKDMEDVLLKLGKKIRAKLLASSHSSFTDSFVSSNASAA
jgi:hypothetical protein